MRAFGLPLLLLARLGGGRLERAVSSRRANRSTSSIAQARREAAAGRLLQQRAELAAGKARDEAARLRLQQLAASSEHRRGRSDDHLGRCPGQAAAGPGARRSAALAREQAPVSALLAGLAMIGRRPALTMIVGAQSPRELIKLKLLAETIAPHVAERSATLARQLERGRAARAGGSCSAGGGRCQPQAARAAQVCTLRARSAGHCAGRTQRRRSARRGRYRSCSGGAGRIARAPQAGRAPISQPRCRARPPRPRPAPAREPVPGRVPRFSTGCRPGLA